MKDVAPPDLFYVRAARSLLESGRHAAAQQELERVDKDLQSHPDVLEVKWGIQAQGRKWTACLDIAEAIVTAVPERPTGWIKRSFVLHKLQRTQEALDRLFPGAEKFGDVPIIHYNLACYAAQLQYLWEAEKWLKQALEIGGIAYRKLALQDVALEPLWKMIGRL